MMMPTHFRGSSATVLALNTYIKLIRATSLVERRMAAHISAQGLTWSQFGVLEALLHLGPLVQKDIAMRILRSPGDLTTILDNLAKRDLIVRQVDPADRRRRIIDLTPQGRELISSIFPNHAETVRDMMAALSPQEQAMLGCLCRTLGHELAEPDEWQGSPPESRKSCLD